MTDRELLELADKAAGVDIGSPTYAHLNRLCQIMSAHGMSTGHGDDMGQVLDELEWQLKERNAQAPVARVTGYYGGRCVIEPLDGKSVFPTRMAVYAHPAPPGDLSDDEIFTVENAVPDDVISDRNWTLYFARAIIAAAKEKK